jgi:hypothetical protein
MFKQWKTWLYIALLLPPTALLIQHAYNGAFTRLISDDYCSIYFGQRLGFLRDIWYWYTTSQGRYSLFAMDTVLVWTGTRGLGAVTTVTMIIWGAAATGILFGIQPKSREFKSRLRDAIIFGIVLVAVMFMLTPDVRQSIYWWNGLATHTLPVVVFVIYLAIYQWARVQKADKRIVVLIAVFATGFAIFNGGYSETFTAAQIALLTFWLAWLFLRKELDFRQPGPAYLLGGLIGALIALVIALISPGNTARQAYFPPSPGVVAIVQISLSSYFAFLKYIFTTPEQILGLIGAFFGFLWLGKQTQPERSIKSWEPLAVFVFGFFILAYACFPPAAFGMSDAPPYRAQIIPAFFVLMSTVSAAFLWGNQLAVKSNPSQGLARESLVLLVIAVVFITAASGISWKYHHDKSKVFIKYAQAWDQNEQKIFAARQSGQKTVIIHSVRNWAGLNDPGDNPKFWVNYCMSKFYEINILSDNTGMQLPDPEE